MAAVEGNLSTWTFNAGADLSAAQFKIVKLNSSGDVVLAALGEPAVGVLQNSPGLNEAATVAVGGISKVSADAALAKGALLTSSADGQAATAAKATVNTSDAGVTSDPVVGSYVLGFALTSTAAAGEVVSMMITHAGTVPTTAA